MPYKQFTDNWKTFSALMESLADSGDEQINILIKSYLEQNLILLNDIFSTSISNLEKLQKANSPDEVICTQARFTNEISKKLASSTQRFLNASLENVSDYNEWLKDHCDLATD